MKAVFMLPGMIIVFCGTFAAAAIGTPQRIFFNIVNLIKMAMFPPVINLTSTIDSIVELSTVARKEGILALEDRAKDITHPFFRKMIMLAVDGIEPDIIRGIAENEIHHIGERHKQGAMLFVKMGGYAPTMGITGTVLGLISVLGNAGEDANELIRGISTAFIATLWGIFTANIVWLPIGDRLKSINEDEMVLLDIIVEGITSIQSGENPSVTGMKLYSMLPGNMQQKEKE
ncbi:MAG TPA: MotA/TolQ/ExbB proton channel family protein [Armatimonadota bacterium]|nr:MotA/TolQ/ExbB proton channel family protein [Armatimonadota bacterium]